MLKEKLHVAAMLAAFVLLSPIAYPTDASLSKRELKALLASATTLADHERLAGHYRLEALKFQAKQAKHESEAAEYYRDPARYPVPKYPTMGQHCRDLAWYYGMKADRAASLAQAQANLAREAP